MLLPLLYQRRSFRGRATKQVLYLRKGKRKEIVFNPQNGQVVLKGETALRLSYIDEMGQSTAFTPGVPVMAPLRYRGSVLVEGIVPGKHSATLVHLLPDGTPNEELTVQAYYFPVELSVEGNCDRTIKHLTIKPTDQRAGNHLNSSIGKTFNNKVPAAARYSEWSKLKIQALGVDSLPAELSLVLEVSAQMAECCSVYRKDALGAFQHILGKNLHNPSAPKISVSPPLPTDEIDCFVEAHRYPGDTFGLITLGLKVKHGEKTISSDRAVYRVAPWVMMSNTLAPAEVYIGEMADNQPFIAEIGAALDELGIPLTIVPKQENRRDRWIQDEIQFGYVQSIDRAIPTVFESPCNSSCDRQKACDSKRTSLGADFGHFQVENCTNSTLETFGNLAVSPPVMVNGRHYPFGRIVTGGHGRQDDLEQPLGMASNFCHFLYAQKIQAPFELYTDWLATGRVSEIVSFIPADNDRKFEVLIASPLSANAILTRLANQGYGETTLPHGVKQIEKSLSPKMHKSAKVTIKTLLENTAFWEANQRYQSYLDINIQILRKELGIDSRHIVHIPVLFYPPFKDGRTAAYFPNTIDHLVLGNTHLVPKPKGPVIDGKCAFEAAFVAAVPSRNVQFIESWDVCREPWGDVRCATNVRREPFSKAHWWN